MGNILIVTDNQALRRYLVGLLGVRGFNSRGVSSGAEALDLLRADPQHCDVVISDMQMPRDGDGPELLRAIRGDGVLQHIPVMVMSRSFTPEEIRIVRQLGAFAWTEKPFNSIAVINVIKAELARLAVQN